MEEKQDNIFTALAAAQAEMKAPVKNAENPGFKRGKDPAMYADLESVVESVRGPLSSHGINWRHGMEYINDQMHMVTYLDHGASGTNIKCPVPLFMDRQNMHGLKSAITYAKRIGLESVTGQAPADDDDGNLAVAAKVEADKRKEEERRQKDQEQRKRHAQEVAWFKENLPAAMCAEDINLLKDRANKAGDDVRTMLATRAKELRLIPNRKLGCYEDPAPAKPAQDDGFSEIDFPEDGGRG